MQDTEEKFSEWAENVGGEVDIDGGCIRVLLPDMKGMVVAFDGQVDVIDLHGRVEVESENPCGVTGKSMLANVNHVDVDGNVLVVSRMSDRYQERMSVFG